MLKFASNQKLIRWLIWWVSCKIGWKTDKIEPHSSENTRVWNDNCQVTINEYAWSKRGGKYSRLFSVIALLDTMVATFFKWKNVKIIIMGHFGLIFNRCDVVLYPKKVKLFFRDFMVPFETFLTYVQTFLFFYFLLSLTTWKPLLPAF